MSVRCRSLVKTQSGGITLAMLTELSDDTKVYICTLYVNPCNYLQNCSLTVKRFKAYAFAEDIFKF